MHPIDWLILIGYLVASLAVGLWLSRRNRSQADYFVAGRQLKGWLAGASMAATTFSVDTPLYVAGLVGARGLAGNWEWWSFGVAHVAMAVVFAPCGAAAACSPMPPSPSCATAGPRRPGCGASRPFCLPCRSTASASAMPFWPWPR